MKLQNFAHAKSAPSGHSRHRRFDSNILPAAVQLYFDQRRWRFLPMALLLICKNPDILDTETTSKPQCHRLVPLLYMVSRCHFPCQPELAATMVRRATAERWGGMGFLCPGRASQNHIAKGRPTGKAMFVGQVRFANPLCVSA